MVYNTTAVNNRKETDRVKTVILFGSPRKDGNTRALTDAFAEALKGHSQTDVRLLYLNDMNLRPCQGCYACSAKGVCKINDDMRDIGKYVTESDLVVYATPVYWWAPSAQLKLVMDRSVMFLDKEFNSRTKGKKAVTLMTCADSDPGTCVPALDIFTRTFRELGMEYAGHVEATGCEGRGEVSASALDEARKLAASLT
jgi:multimeric flavodoxin WrbA